MSKIREQKKTLKDGTQVTLRSPGKGEGEEILKVARSIFPTSPHLLSGNDEFDFTIEQEEAFIEHYSLHPGKVILTPTVNQKIIGILDFSVGAKRKISHHGSFGISLLKEYQGLGLGKLMIEALFDWARSTGTIEVIRLRVFSKNLDAYSLYNKLGFQEEGREVKGVKNADGSYDDVISMAKCL